MAETLESALERVRLRVESLKRETKDQMRAANVLCGLIPCAILYPDADTEEQGGLTAIASDTYYGQDTADVIEDILRRRKLSSKGAASVADIFEAMKSGGYEFTASNDDNAKRGVYISLGKNPKFHKLPNGDYGLTVWYPAIKGTKESKPKNGGTGKGQPDSAPDLDSDLDLDAAVDGIVDGVISKEAAVDELLGAAVGTKGGAAAAEEKPKKPR